MNLDFEYSVKETELINALGFLDISARLAPMALYRLMANRCFRDNRQDKISESLRRCYIALEDCSISRRTKAFDDLIDL